MTIAAAIEDKQEVWRQGYTDYGLHVMLQGAVPPDVDRPDPGGDPGRLPQPQDLHHRRSADR
jgi:hypothetical protein